MDMIGLSATNGLSRPPVGVARTAGSRESISAGRDDHDVDSTLLRIFDFALIVAMVAAPFLLTTLTPQDARQQIHTASAGKTVQASAP